MKKFRAFVKKTIQVIKGLTMIVWTLKPLVIAIVGLWATVVDVPGTIKKAAAAQSASLDSEIDSKGRKVESISTIYRSR